ncbi:hypothetical protein BDR06DRAFT_542227 [Suillus hirtellus]|nr:hypothetical protein BDR06DRAFT_542227 [Suillus hirtellus]
MPLYCNLDVITTEGALVSIDSSAHTGVHRTHFCYANLHQFIDYSTSCCITYIAQRPVLFYTAVQVFYLLRVCDIINPKVVIRWGNCIFLLLFMTIIFPLSRHPPTVADFLSRLYESSMSKQMAGTHSYRVQGK